MTIDIPFAVGDPVLVLRYGGVTISNECSVKLSLENFKNELIPEFLDNRVFAVDAKALERINQMRVTKRKDR